MEENDIRVFIDSTTHYFNHVTNVPAEVQAPYLVEYHSPLVYDFTGMIGIAGNRRGTVYFTARKPMVHHLLMLQGENDMSSENCCDIVGEIANTLSGNARRVLGKDFMISVPIVFDGSPQRLQLSRNCRSYVIPIQWRNHRAALTVSLE